MKKKQSQSKARRGFLKTAASVGAGAAAATLLPSEVMASQEPEQQEPQKKKGYRVSQHVVDYYKSAGI